MKLSKLEEDLLGDLGRDDHSLHEFFGFVRAHHKGAADAEVLGIGRAMIVSWLERGWLQFAGEGAMWNGLTDVAEVLPLIDRLGVDATHFFLGSPWLRPTEKAYADVQWLRGTA